MRTPAITHPQMLPPRGGNLMASPSPAYPPAVGPMAGFSPTTSHRTWDWNPRDLMQCGSGAGKKKKTGTG
ncbi:unnamed protein product [Cuscuta campestris]|uniref:Uncharacterized protein n=1 Tax=Cuscuta campestris TaxID=132261 RepID=A0A484KZN5_9ASTE|nr:unnamed protein product [Cuscuta campestris]